MADIKTRDAVKGTIKTLDKAAIAGERMKSAYAKTKDKAEQGYYAEENSPTEYAADKVSHASGRIRDEGVHQFNNQGQKSGRRQGRMSERQRINLPILRQKGRQKLPSRKKHRHCRTERLSDPKRDSEPFPCFRRSCEA